jgi:hypothetical protein
MLTGHLTETQERNMFFFFMSVSISLLCLEQKEIDAPKEETQPGETGEIR